jgi:hypothetical protein
MPPHEEADQTISTCRFEIRPRWQAPLHIAKLTRRAIALTAKAVRLRHFREGSLPPGLMLARRASYELVENVPPNHFIIGGNRS